MNPAMSNAKLRAVCEDLGLDKVATVISSGNIVFETEIADRAGLEATLEAAWPRKLGFESTTILRTRAELEGLVELAPFGDLEHGPTSYLLVTFSKYPVAIDFELPHYPPDRDWSIVTATDGEVFTVSDTTSTRGLDVMATLEDRFGKQVSSRTWLTVSRILKKMGAG
jgi:uncharacterized protein (DUF1697 family)